MSVFMFELLARCSLAICGAQPCLELFRVNIILYSSAIYILPDTFKVPPKHAHSQHVNIRSLPSQGKLRLSVSFQSESASYQVANHQYGANESMGKETCTTI
jgi:hypothetical protein